MRTSGAEASSQEPGTAPQPGAQPPRKPAGRPARALVRWLSHKLHTPGDGPGRLISRRNGGRFFYQAPNAPRAIARAVASDDERTRFPEALDQALNPGDRRGAGVLVAIVNVDRHRALNVALGPGAGRELRQGIGRRLLRCLRATDTVAQHGGGEYGLLLTGNADSACATRVLGKIVRAIDGPLSIRGQTHVLTVGVGAVQCAGRPAGAHPLLLGAGAS